MTDTLDDKQKEIKSFKEKILEDLRRAHEEREKALEAARIREEELRMALVEAELEARKREEELRLAEEARRREEELKKALQEAERQEAAIRAKEAEAARIEAMRQEELRAKERAEQESLKAEKIAKAQAARQEAYRQAAEKEKRDQLLKELAEQERENPELADLTITERAKQRMIMAEELLSQDLTHQEVSTPELEDNSAGASIELKDTSLDQADLAEIDTPEVSIPVVEEQAPVEKKVEPELELADTGNMRKRKMNLIAMRISAILVTVIVVLGLVTAFMGYRYVSGALAPVNRQSTDYVQVQIPEGSGNKLIGQILEDSGVIKNASVFNYYTKFKNYANLKSGYYNLTQSMSVADIIKKLQEGGTQEPTLPPLGKVRITEGYSIKQIANAVADNVNTKKTTDKTPFDSQDFLDLIQDDSFIQKMSEKYPKLFASLPDKADVKYQLEGYLFPATYDYYDDTTLEALVEQMIAAMDANLAPYYASIASQNMTVNEVLTLASLVEKEGSTDEDRKQIASVFENRIAQDMPLQSNIAILYAMDKLGEKTTLAEDAGIDTNIDSPYNIYVNKGLMPGPVDSPSLSAIEAVISPAQTDYLYFVADVTTGKVYYAVDYDTHSANVEKYVNSKLAN